MLHPCLTPARRLAAGAFVFACLAGAALPAPAADPFAENVRSTPWLSPADEQKTFRLPPGFEIQLFAAEPDLLKPMNLAFDAQGRMWATVTREYPYPAPLDQPGRDAIKILDDTDGDGRADKVTTFADGLNIPIGIYPFQSRNQDGRVTWKAVAWSIPNLWLFEDTDGDGQADKREVLYGPFDHTRDTHGNQASFRRGFDGWLYCTHGYNNRSKVRGKDGHEVTLNSGNTYRIRLDGSRIEHHTHGQVNPFGLAFDPLGNLFSSDCHSAPIYQLLAGGWYPSFGAPHDGLGFAPTMMEQPRGSTALDGISCYADNLWPAEFRENLFIGDVMMSRIFRDRTEEVGATKIARPAPDFVTTDDPWFRPVDTQLGPDGALYIADFYNRIIGHYEVPLNHPGRDRTSGRIWRVVHRGADGRLKTHPREDFTRLPAAELVGRLNHPNLTARRLISDQLTDRLGPAALPAVREALAGSEANSDARVHLLWVLHRLGALDEPALVTAAQARDRVLRVHAMRLLRETPQLSPRLRELAVAGLKDADALVQRCAAEALAGHPAHENLAPLLALRQRVPEKDTHLLYVVRRALRDHLAVDELFARFQQPSLDDPIAFALADVALGVPSGAAGQFLIGYVQRSSVNQERAAEYLRHAARYAPESSFTELGRTARRKFGEDADLQLALFTSIRQGLEQRGAALNAELKDWGAQLAENLLSAADANDPAWRNTPLPGVTDAKNPWFVQRRASADGNKNSRFLCSLPPGGEHLTGVLSSKPFAVPARLSFFLAGHDGYPDRPAQKKNVVRLRAVGSDQMLAEVYPPRNDTAQPVHWDLAAHAGKPAYLEVTDGDTGNAYAWLAVGRFEPPVVAIPRLDPSEVSKRQLAAADLARALRLANLQPPLQRLVADAAAEPATRAAAALALVTFRPNEPLAALVPLIGDTAVPAGWRNQVCLTVAGQRTATAADLLNEALRTLPHRAQLKLAQALAGNPASAEMLLQRVANKQAPAMLLLDRTVKDKLLATKLPKIAARWEELTKDQTPPAAELQRLIEKRLKTYSAANASAAKGTEVFTKNCAACHQIEGQGAVIGPQLDGIGTRGLERLSEDVFDPNRNIDPAFRSTLLVLDDGDVVSGLFRREEGETLILADSTGKEVVIPKKQITERRQSDTSLMPSNYGELLSEEDFNALMTFLLSKGTAPAGR